MNNYVKAIRNKTRYPVHIIQHVIEHMDLGIERSYPLGTWQHAVATIYGVLKEYERLEQLEPGSEELPY